MWGRFLYFLYYFFAVKLQKFFVDYSTSPNFPSPCGQEVNDWIFGWTFSVCQCTWLISTTCVSTCNQPLALALNCISTWWYNKHFVPSFSHSVFFFLLLFYRRQLRQLHRLGLQKRDSVCVRIWVEGYRILWLPPTWIPDQPDLHWDYEGSESHRIRPAEEVWDRQGQISLYMTALQLHPLSYLSQHLIFLFGIQYSSQILSGDELTRTSKAWILICFSCFLTLLNLFSLSCDTIRTHSCGGFFCVKNQRVTKPFCIQ